MKTIIFSANAPKAIGPYSQAVKANGTLYISGTLGIDPVTNDLRQGIEAQTRQALDNIKAILQAANMSMDNVVKTTVLLKNLADFATVNEIYATYFTSDYPARACYEVVNLPKAGLIEIEAIAVE